MAKFGIYYRVSTDKQDLESQIVAVEKWIADLPQAQKPTQIKVFQDTGMSGNSMNRPGLKMLLDAAYKGAVDTIVVYKLDRFSRQATLAIRLILTLDEVGVAFISVTQPVLNLGHENPFRRTMLAAFAEVAQLERETIIARIQSGIAAARKKGVTLGAPKKLTPQKREEAKALKAQGLGFREISRKLKLSLGSIHTLLKDSGPT